MTTGQTVALMQQDACLSPGEEESRLVNRLAIPLIPPQPIHACGYDFILRFEQKGLTLYSTKPDAPGGLCVDFTGKAIQRRGRESLKNQNLGKALGLKTLRNPAILDATAGLGTDSYLFAAAACHVTMLEKNPVVHALLEDGMERAASHDHALKVIMSRMHLTAADLLHAELATESFDVVYLDPMFPAKKKSARSGKGMYLLQQLIVESSDEVAMLEHALKLARKRVVVKRARLSPSIGEKRPDISFTGSSNRFDVYFGPGN